MKIQVLKCIDLKVAKCLTGLFPLSKNVKSICHPQTYQYSLEKEKSLNLLERGIIENIQTCKMKILSPDP